MSTTSERMGLSHPDMLTGHEDLESEGLSTPAALKGWIVRARKAARPRWLTQQRLADELGESVSVVRRWENLELPDLPTDEELAKICLACGLYEPELEFELPKPRPDGISRTSDRRPAYVPQPCETLSAEIGEVAKVLAFKAFPPSTAERNVAIYVDRYAGGMTLQELGDRHAMTRERARQILAKMQRHLGYAADAPRSCFDALRQALATLSVEREDQLEERLKPLLGECTLRAAMEYGSEVLGETLEIELTRTRRGDVVAVQPGAGDWHAAALKFVRRQVRVHGAALLPLIWAYVQAEHAEPIPLAQLREFLTQSSGFAWLDDEQMDWFWFGPEDSNHPAEIVMQILRVAGRPVDIEEVYAGLVRQRRRPTAHATSLPEMYPPPYILQRVMAAYPGIESFQIDRLRLTEGAASMQDTSPVTTAIVQELQSLGGVASRGELRERVVAEDGHNHVTFGVALTNSPLIRRLAWGIYALPGIPIDVNHYARAVAALEEARLVPVTAGSDGSYTWTGILSPHMATNRFMYLPVGVSGLEEGPLQLGNGHVVVVVDNERGDRKIKRAVAELIQMGLDVGDGYRVTIWPAERRCKFEAIQDDAHDTAADDQVLEYVAC